MAVSGKRSKPILVDTSVAVALVVEDHASHETVLTALDGRQLGLAGHALFETYSVLTRLPGPSRRSPEEVTQILKHNFPHSRFLDAEGSTSLSERLATLGVSGGSVYDALVGETAVRHRMSLATSDQRAIPTYERLGVSSLRIG